MATMMLLIARRFVDADDQQCRHHRDDHHRRHIDDRAGRVPGVLRGIVGERRSGESGGNDDAEILEEAHDVARPADRDRGRAERIFQDQVPADDPGDEFAHRRISISIGAAGDRNGRSHFRIAKPGKGADDGAKHEGQSDRRPGICRSGMAGENENAGADNGADAERDDMDRGQAALERHAVMRSRAPGPRGSASASNSASDLRAKMCATMAVLQAPRNAVRVVSPRLLAELTTIECSFGCKLAASRLRGNEGVRRSPYIHGISDAWITSGTPSSPTERMARSTSLSPKRWVVTSSSGKRFEASCASASSQAL